MEKCVLAIVKEKTNWNSNAVNRFKRTIYFLDALEIIMRQFEALSVHILIEWSHYSRRIIRMFQSQSMTKLVDCHKEQVITCGVENNSENTIHRICFVVVVVVVVVFFVMLVFLFMKSIRHYDSLHKCLTWDPS